MDNNTYISDDELMHWGVLGMKWGIRRYQNKDGTLTAAGKKRYKAEMDKVREKERILKNRKATQDKLDKLAARKKAAEDQEDELDGKKKKSEAKPKSDTDQKPLSEMSDDELAAKIRRIQLEQQYKSLTAQPETVKKGNGFVRNFMEKAVVPAIQEGGKSLIKDWLVKAGKDHLGLSEKDTKDSLDELERTVKRLDLEKRYRKHMEDADESRNSNSNKAGGSGNKSGGSDSKSSILSSLASKLNKRDDERNNSSKSSSRNNTSNSDTSDNDSRNSDTDYSYSTFGRGVVTAKGTNRRKNSNLFDPGEIIFTPISDIPTSSVSSGKAFVGRYDRTSIGRLDDD